MKGLRNWVVWSLYDGSGYAVKDWAEAGYKCYCFNYDGANHGDYEGVKIIHPNIEYVNVWIDSHFLVMFSPVLSVYPAPDIILAFPPCDISRCPALAGLLISGKKIQTSRIRQRTTQNW